MGRVQTRYSHRWSVYVITSAKGFLVCLGPHTHLLQQHSRWRHRRSKSEPQMLHPPLVKPRHRRSRHPSRLPLIRREERRRSELIRSGSHIICRARGLRKRPRHWYKASGSRRGYKYRRHVVYQERVYQNILWQAGRGEEPAGAATSWARGQWWAAVRGCQAGGCDAGLVARLLLRYCCGR